MTDPGNREADLGFSLRVQDGRAALVLDNRLLFGWLRVERLELEIPEINLPVDTTVGSSRFQRRRCRVAQAAISVDDEALGAMVARALPEAWKAGRGATGFEELRVRVLEGAVEISGRARVGDRGAELTARATLRPSHGRGVRVVVSEVRVYGFLPRATSLVAHDLVCTLTRAGEADGPEAGIARGLGDVEIQPLDAILWQALPPAGWRMPDASAVRASTLSLRRGKLVARFAPEADTSGTTISETSDALREADNLLLAGDAAGAVSAYRGEIARGGPDTPAALERLLGVLVGSEETLREAGDLARDVVTRWPDLVPAHLALAVAAAERGRGSEAGEHFAQVVALAEQAGEDEDLVRASIAAARFLRDGDARRATPYYERVVERRPAHAEAVEALIERYAAEGRVSDLVRLSRRRIAATEDKREQAREHVRLGEVYLARIGDTRAARDELERATRLHEADPRAWDGLGRALAALGDHQGAVRALDRVAQLHAAKGDALGEARTHARIAQLWEAAGDQGAAHLRYRSALERSPDDLEVLERLAEVAAGRGHFEEASRALARIAELAVAAADEPRRRRARRELAGLALEHGGDLGAAREHLARAVGGTDEEEADRLALLAEVEERADDIAAATMAMEQAAELTLPGPLSAKLALELARLCEIGGRRIEADEARERAFLLAPDTAGATATQALAVSARSRGDAAAEARWLDALLSLAPPAPDTALRRAELALAAGNARGALAYLDRAPGLATSRLRAEALREVGEPAAATELFAKLAAAAEGTDRVRLLVEAARTALAADDRPGALGHARAALAAALALAEDTGAARENLVEEARQILGETAWERRAWDDVIAAYEPLLEHGTAERAPGGEDMTPWAEAARRLGMALERAGREADALKIYGLAVEDEVARGEPLAVSWRRLAELWERRGDFARAADTRAASAADIRTAESPAARADEHHRAAELLRKRLGQPARAVVELEAALRLVAEHMPSLDALESIHGEAKDHERVAAILGRKIAATARQPERQKALLARLADLQHRFLGRPDAAREAYRRALELDADFRPALAFLADDARARGDGAEARALWSRLAAVGDAEERLGALLAQFDLDREAGQADDAERALLGAIELAPDRVDLLARLEELYLDTGRWLQAATVMGRRAARAHDPEERVLLDLKRIELLIERVNDPAAARAATNAALARSPGEVRLWRRSAELARREDDAPALAEAVEKLAKLAPPTPGGAAEPDVASVDALLELAQRGGDAARFSALAQRRRELGIDPASAAKLALDEARLLLSQDDEEDALRVLSAVGREAADVELLLMRADLEEEQGSFRDAARDLSAVRARAALRGDAAGEAQVTRRLATMTLERLRDDQAAERLYLRALELDGEDVAAAEGLVAIAERRGDAARAAAALERLVDVARRTAVGPAREAEILVEWARKLRALGDAVGARERLEEAGAVAPRDQGVLRARAEQAELDGDMVTRAKLLEALLTVAGQEATGELEAEAATARQEAVRTEDEHVEELEELARAHVSRSYPVQADPDEAEEEEFEEGPRGSGRTGTGEDPVTLSAALAERARDLVSRGLPFDDTGRELLAQLRTSAHLSGGFAPLADGLCAAAAAEPDASFAAAWFAEAAALRKSALKDRGGAIDALSRALALRPSDASVVVELDAVLRDAGDYARLADVYELHLSSKEGAGRAPILFELGTLYAEALGDPAHAAKLYEEARTADPTFTAVLLPLADYHYAEEDATTAEDFYRRALHAGVVPVEDRAVVVGRLGELALKRGDVPEAIARFREGLEALEARRRAGEPRSPLRATIWSWLEHALRAAGEWEDVVHLLLLRGREESDAAKRIPILREAADLLEHTLDQPDDARSVWGEISRIDPNDQEARARAGSRRSGELTLVGAPDGEEVVLDLEPPGAAAAARAEANRPPVGRRFLGTDHADGIAAEGSPGFGDAMEKAGERKKLRDAEDWPVLLEALDRDALSASPSERAQLIREAASVAAQLGDPDGALRRLGEAIFAAQDDIERAMLRADRAELLARMERLPEARADLDDALAVMPPTGMAHLALGRVHLAEQDPEGALPYLLAAADRDELDVKLTAEAHLLAGHAHETLGQVEAAMARYEQASAIDPFDPRPLDALYVIGEARGDHELLAELIGRRILLGESNAERARLWVKRARIYLDILHREPEAYRCFKEAVANDPTCLEAAQGLRLVAVGRGEWALVAELLYREIEACQDFAAKAELHVELAQVFEERLHDVDAAIRNHESSMLIDPSSPVPPSALARLYALKKRFEDAARADETAARFDHDPAPRAQRLLRAGDHMERGGHLDEARRLWLAAADIPGGGDAASAARAKAARLGDDVAPARRRAILMDKLASGDDPSDRLALLKQLLALAVEAEDDPEIDVRSREVLVRDPADSTAFLQRRRLLQQRGEWVALADLYRTRADAVDDEKERASLYFDLGRICAQRLSDPGRAALAFEQALRDDPTHAAALDALADMAYRQHDWDRAYALYARLDPEASFLGQDVVHYRRGELAEMLGHEDQAEAAYRAAVGANTSHLAALEAQARLALYRGEVSAAIGALKAVLELLPLDDVERITAARQQLGELCQKAGDAAAARGYFELVLVEDPSRIPALSPLADLYSGSGMWQKAGEALGRLSYLVTSPEKRADLLFRMGEIYRLHLDDEDKASEAYLKAIDLDPRHIPTMRRLIDYYWSVGDDPSLAEMAAELDTRGELVSVETSHETLGKVVVSTALAGDLPGAIRLMRQLGEAAVGALAAVLADAVMRRPRHLDDLVKVARTLCVPPGPALQAVKAVLLMRAPKDEHAQKIAVLL